jgi:1-acyl-sn-glycerol-3-phosphate acyltransferase
VIFPEGNRTEDGAMQDLKPGISLVLKKAPVPVLPLALAGAYEGWPRWRKLPRLAPLFLPPEPGCLGVVFGPVIPAEKLLAMEGPQMLAFLHAEIARLKTDAEKLRRKP